MDYVTISLKIGCPTNGLWYWRFYNLEVVSVSEIVWGSPASLFCLGFFFAGVGVFIYLARKNV